MSGENPAPATGAPEQTTEPAGDPLGEGGMKALKAEREARDAAEAKVRELQPLADKLAEIENANKDELTKANEKIASTAAERDAALSEAATLRAAIKHGLTGDDLELLGTGTPEEIEQRAAKLAARLGDASQTKRPKPDPTQGGDASATSSNADAFAEALGLD